MNCYLRQGENLQKGQSIASTNGFFKMTLQQDSNLVITDVRHSGSRIIWSTNTTGKNADELSMQVDGNLVLYSTDTHYIAKGGGDPRNILFQSGTPFLARGTILRLNEDGNCMMYVPTWSSGTDERFNAHDVPDAVRLETTSEDYIFGGNILYGNQELKQNQEIVSQNGKFRAVLQVDGNFVVYAAGKPEIALWSTKTVGKGGTRIVIQESDGDLVLYRADNSPVWASKSPKSPGSILLMQNDGNLVSYVEGWATNSAQTLSPKLGG